MKGDLHSRTALKLVREWIDLRHEELVEDWKLAGKGKEIKKIDPLELRRNIAVVLQNVFLFHVYPLSTDTTRLFCLQTIALIYPHGICYMNWVSSVLQINPDGVSETCGHGADQQSCILSQAYDIQHTVHQ